MSGGIFALIGAPSPYYHLMFPTTLGATLALPPEDGRRISAVAFGPLVTRFGREELEAMQIRDLPESAGAQTLWPFTKNELRVIELRRKTPGGSIPYKHHAAILEDLRREALWQAHL